MYVYVPLIATKKVQADSSPLPSAAIHTTSLFPIRNSDPDGGKHMTSRCLPLMSLTEGSCHTTIAVGLLGSVDPSRFAGQTGSGALT